MATSISRHDRDGLERREAGRALGQIKSQLVFKYGPIGDIYPIQGLC